MRLLDPRLLLTSRLLWYHSLSMQTSRHFLLAVFVCVLCGASVVGQAQAVQSPLPNPTGHVSDYAGIIDPATEKQMEAMLTNLDKRANVEFGVVTVKTTGGQDIFDYSLAVMRGWGIGSSEKGGVLLLVAVDDRKYFTQVSRHLEGDLPDSVVGSIGRRMRDYFRQNQYNEGVMYGVQTLVATLAEKRGFNIEGIDQRFAQREAEQPRRARDSSGGGISGCTLLFIILVVVLLLLASRRGGGGGGGGCLNLLLLNTLLNSGGGGYHSSGWGGGGFGGSSGGGGGFGGFSGGGGDAGGGGGGGSW
ncbi:MAG: TPM domain-containing protein [Pyrinomonadaceae bacterium]|nr:TPM domain-containing protein [Pyrinomonadaceae bacterium]